LRRDPRLRRDTAQPTKTSAPIATKVTDLPTVDCYPITLMPGLSRLFLDYCSSEGQAHSFYGSNGLSSEWQTRPAVPSHWSEMVEILAKQNPSSDLAPALTALAQGAGTVVTGQQVGLFGGPMFTPLKAATALARARQATAAGKPHVGIFWLASEDHDFAEIDHVVLPANKTLETLHYTDQTEPEAARPVGDLVFDERIVPVVERAQELLGPSEATDALAAAYRPGRTFAQAFRDFYTAVFGKLGLLILDANSREVHRLGAPVLRAALERADELHAALLERNAQLEAAGYHAQVAVVEHASLLFLVEEDTGARVALRRMPPTADEPNGQWLANGKPYTTEELIAILDNAPERISPSALLRPVFQDYLLSTSLIIGGPAEIAYFAQSAVLYERILGRQTPAAPRFSATIVEQAIGKLLRKHELSIEQVLAENAASLAQQLAERSMPTETKQKLKAASNALDTELKTLVEWMQSQDKGLGQSAETAAGKIHYQMHRLRTLAANFQLQRENSYTRHAESIMHALYPDGHLQERLHGAAFYFARHGFALAETLVQQAESTCPGHSVIWL
jgi:bacillithiol biosynthesis cysteine-adding enzyme BshC